jgi:hypothetical protein
MLRTFRNSRWADWLAAALYVPVAILVTFPTTGGMGSLLYGCGDSLYYIWVAWWRKYSLLNGLDYYFLSLSQAPFGTDMVFRSPPAVVWSLGLLSIPFGEVAAYNLMILGGYVLSGVSAYLLARQFTRSRVVSFLAGLVFAFSPYGISHSNCHVMLAQQWVVALFILALFNLNRRQSLLAAVLLGAAFALAAYMHAYMGYHVTIAAITFAVVETIGEWRRGGWRSALTRRMGLYALAAVMGLILYLPELSAIWRELHHGPASPMRSESTLWQNELWYFLLSSRPWSFFLPPEGHPLLGGLALSAREYIEHIPRLNFAPPILQRLYPDLSIRWFWYTPVTSNDFYIGYICLASVGYTVWRWSRGDFRKGTGAGGEETCPERDLWIRYFVILFVVALLFTVPPYLPVGAALRPLWEPLHNVVIPMPALLTMHVAPPLRDSSRFMVLVMLAVAVLASVGLDHMLQRISSAPKRMILIASFAGILVFEYFRLPNVLPMDTPQEYLWLADQPRGTIIATYPFGSHEQIVFQRIHELPVIDSVARDASLTMDNLYQVEEMAIGSLDSPALGPKLAAMGVHYVVNADEPLDFPPEGLLLLFTTDTAQVFEVAADPAPLVVLYTLRDGLWMSDATWAWQGEEYTITVWNPLNEAHHVTITLAFQGEPPEGPLLASRALTPHPAQVIRSGLLIANPSIPPDYPAESVSSETIADGVVFRGLLFQPGETTLGLRWGAVQPGDSYPQVTGIHFDLLDPPGSGEADDD